MKVIKTPIEGLLVIEPNIFYDNRGYFCETYNVETFKRNGIDVTFVQDNKSYSNKNVLRGLHYQTGAFAQDKLVSVTWWIWTNSKQSFIRTRLSRVWEAKCKEEKTKERWV